LPLPLLLPALLFGVPQGSDVAFAFALVFVFAFAFVFVFVFAFV
jgi:hypothetical protein